MTVLAPWRTAKAHELTSLQRALAWPMLQQLIRRCDPEVLMVHGNGEGTQQRRSLENPYVLFLAKSTNSKLYPPLRYGNSSLKYAEVTIENRKRLLVAMPHLSYPRKRELFEEGLPRLLQCA